MWQRSANSKSSPLRRVSDIVFSACALILCLPLLGAVATAIVLESGFPVLFLQTRVGRFGRRFQIVKFRSMADRTGPGVTSVRDPRITKTGRFIRRYKLDELPQLWNVLRGDMSLIGPRPEVPQFVDASDPTWKKVLSVPPGITDFASLVYRDEESLLAEVQHPEEYYRARIVPTKLRLNVQYMSERTVWTDIKLLLLTAGCSFLPGVFDHRRLVKAPPTES